MFEQIGARARFQDGTLHIKYQVHKMQTYVYSIDIKDIHINTNINMHNQKMSICNYS